MRSLLLLVAVIWSLGQVQAFGPGNGTPKKTADKGIQFRTMALQDALSRARQSNQLVFVHLYTRWCGPCKQMKRTSFFDAAVAQFFNRHFINLAVDAEEGEGPELAERFAVTAVPTLLILNSHGVVLGRTVGFQTTDQLLAFARKAAAAK